MAKSEPEECRVGCRVSADTLHADFSIDVGNAPERVGCAGCVGDKTRHARTFVAILEDRGVTLWAAPGGKLRYSPKEALDSGDIANLKTYKTEILAVLSERVYNPTHPAHPTLLDAKPDGNGENPERNSEPTLHKPYTPPYTPTPHDEVRREREYRQLVAEGMAPRFAREAVYGESGP